MNFFCEQFARILIAANPLDPILTNGNGFCDRLLRIFGNDVPVDQEQIGAFELLAG
jgi:hypothetical protein